MLTDIGIDLYEYMEFNKWRCELFLDELKRKLIGKHIRVKYEETEKGNNILSLRFA